MKHIIFLIFILFVLVISGCSNEEGINLSKMNQSEKIDWFKSASNAEKKEILTAQQYHVIINKQMEATFLGKLTYNDKEGDYYSVVCDYHMFSSADKFKGNTGWLDFDAINLSNAQFKENYRLEHLEVYSICGEYLGYVVDNAALESGKHFIINSESLQFVKK